MTDGPQMGTRAPHGDGDSGIQAVSRAAGMLQLFTEERPEMTLAELVREFGRGKTTTHRYATVLRQEGLLRMDPRSGRYSLGTRLIRLGRIAQAHLHVVEVAGALLPDAAAELNETVVLSLAEGMRPVVIRVAYPPARPVFVGLRIGERLSPLAAQDKVLRAHTEPNVAADPELAEVLERGYSMHHDECNQITAIAAAILEDGNPVATVAVVGTAGTMPPDACERCGRRLVRLVEEVESRLGAGERDRLTGTR
jgi:DNA-binding IclR family transcriptional regulator